MTHTVRTADGRRWTPTRGNSGHLCSFAFIGGFLLFVVSAALLPAANPYITQAAREGASGRREVLLSHGVNATPNELVAFLQSGFSSDAILRGLPGEPSAKTEVVNVAIQELGFQEVQEAVPVLTQIVESSWPAGVASILAQDVESLPLDKSTQLGEIYRETARVNAIVALGLIGDPAAAPSIHQAGSSSKDLGLRLEAAMALGLLEDPRAMDLVSGLVRSHEQEELPALFGAVYFLTGRNWGVSQHTSFARRREIVRDFKASSGTKQGVAERPERQGILRRRATGIQEPKPTLTTLRDALKASRWVEDYDLRYAAREYLAGLTPANAEELRAIVRDPLEDLDVRRAAMTYYASLDPKQARKEYKKLRDDDENVVIRRQAAALLPDIEKLIDAKD